MAQRCIQHVIYVQEWCRVGLGLQKWAESSSLRFGHVNHSVVPTCGRVATINLSTRVPGIFRLRPTRSRSDIPYEGFMRCSARFRFAWEVIFAIPNLQDGRRIPPSVSRDRWASFLSRILRLILDAVVPFGEWQPAEWNDAMRELTSKLASTWTQGRIYIFNKTIL